MSGRLAAPGVLKCLAVLVLMDVLPRVLGLRRSFEVARRLGDVRHACQDAALVDETARHLVLAAAFYPRRALCLEQSLALYVLLRRRGVAAELKIGVQPLPFQAHAWVEVGGRALQEHGVQPSQFATFAGLGV
jgi:hypothetical protein